VAEELVGSMACVVLPSRDQEALAAMQTHLMAVHQLSYVYSHVTICCEDGVDKVVYFVRISAQVYLEMADFELFAKEVKSYLNL
jgi:hypothetical protein